MNSKNMEGLIGARTNINTANTPMNIYKRARRDGDTATMERSMGYVNEYTDRAKQYKAEADEGMKEDAKEARKKAEAEREKTIEKRRKDREKLEERIEESRKSREGKSREDKVEISEDGKTMLEENKENTDFGGATFIDKRAEDAGEVNEAVTYTKMGEVSQTEKGANISISV